MERRDFFATLGAGAGAAACATRGLPPASDNAISVLTEDEILAHVAATDATLDTIARSSPGLGDSVLVGQQRVKNPDALLRSSFRSLWTVGRFHDLPEEARLHPAVQDQMFAMNTELDQTVTDTSDLLLSLTDAEKRQVTRILRERPHLPNLIAEHVEENARRNGVSLARRLHLRRLILEIGHRMRQSTSLLVDRYERRLKRMREQCAAHPDPNRRLRLRLGERRFRELEHRTHRVAHYWRHHGKWRSRSVLHTDDQQLSRSCRDGKNGLKVGGIMLGVSALVGGLGLLIVSAGEFGGVFLVTLGVVGIIAALIVLLVAGIQWSVRERCQ